MHDTRFDPEDKFEFFADEFEFIAYYFELVRDNS